MIDFDKWFRDEGSVMAAAGCSIYQVAYAAHRATHGDFAKVINREWVKRYGGDPVSNVLALENRIVKIGEDRDCWLANAKAIQAEYLKLEAKGKI